MFTLQIEHAIADFASWKKAFESDPTRREKSGVRAYRISRPIADEKYVMIDLDFDTSQEADAFLEALRVLWGGVEGKIMMNPKTRIVEVLETRQY